MVWNIYISQAHNLKRVINYVLGAFCGFIIIRWILIVADFVGTEPRIKMFNIKFSIGLCADYGFTRNDLQTTELYSIHELLHCKTLHKHVKPLQMK